MTPELLMSALFAIITASTPLVIAALGEHVVEKAGVLNLGVEGMMIMGAAVGFGACVVTGSPWLGVLAGIAAGMSMSAFFGLFALGLATNQVATGLALTIFGLGASGIVGAPFVGAKIDALANWTMPGLSAIPVVGPLLFDQNPIVYLAVLLMIGVWYALERTRFGLVLRGVGENHHSADALGLPVVTIRWFAILFGGAMSGLAGAFLSLVYTPFWAPGMTAGKGWIALALVVFAGGRLWRLVLGAALFGAMTYAQLSAQAGGIGIPAQFLSAVPYLATILALILLSVAKRRSTSTAGSLGQPFVPDA
jgi:general nucleoside transport system permease protein